MTPAEIIKKIIALRNRLDSGIVRRHIARNKLLDKAAYPFPKNIAPMYFPGRIPPSPNVELCITPKDMESRAASASST